MAPRFENLNFGKPVISCTTTIEDWTIHTKSKYIALADKNPGAKTFKNNTHGCLPKDPYDVLLEKLLRDNRYVKFAADVSVSPSESEDGWDKSAIYQEGMLWFMHPYVYFNLILASTTDAIRNGFKRVIRSAGYTGDIDLVTKIQTKEIIKEVKVPVVKEVVKEVPTESALTISTAEGQINNLEAFMKLADKNMNLLDKIAEADKIKDPKAKQIYLNQLENMTRLFSGGQ